MTVHSSSHHDPASQQIADFELFEELGRGGLNVVHRARRGDRDYAVKLQRDPAQDDSTKRMFRREAAVLSHLRHPGLVEIHAVGETDGRPYMVMELLRGQTLGAALAGSGVRFDERRLIALARDCAGALAAAHGSGLVHRDVKPDNLIIGPDGHTKLIDFGLVTNSGTQQHRDVAVGTIRYSPPEQTGMLKRPIDGRSDLYSLGVVLYEAAAGHPPFEASDVGELVRLHAAVKPPDLHEAAPDLSPAFVAIIERLLAKDPDDRYQTGEGLLADLDRLAAHAGPEPASFAIGLHDDPSAVIRDLPMVGRKEELSQLQARWHAAVRGRGSVALIAGRPGGGKSRLAREVLLAAGKEDALILSGKVVRNSPVPLAALREAIDGHLRRVANLPAEARGPAEELVRRAAAVGGPLATNFSPALSKLVGTTSATNDSGDRQEQYLASVAAFFIALATSHGTANLYLDDVQWLDDATLRVLELICLDLPTTPLLVTATSRDDAESSVRMQRFIDGVGPALRASISLRPLDEAATGELVREQLGGIVGDDDFIRLIHNRSGGNPFAAVEYVRAVLHAGLISPFWGRFVVDRAGLDRLTLPDDVTELVLARVDELGHDARSLLAAGAAMGTRFNPAFLGVALQVEEARVNNAVVDALRERLIEHAEGGDFAFVHDRIREALLEPLSESDRRALHQRIAEALVATGGDDVDHAFEIARHLAQGETDRTPDKLFTWSERAGRAALAGHASTEAARFFQVAANAAEQLGRPLDADFYETWGQIHTGTGDLAALDRAFSEALERSTDGLQQARIHLQLARTAVGVFETKLALTHAAAGIDATGDRYHDSGPRLFWGSIKGLVVGLFMLITRRGLGDAAQGPQREVMALRLGLHEAAQHALFLQADALPTLAMFLRSLPLALRVGRSAELAHLLGNLGVAAASSSMTGLSKKLSRKAIEIAEWTGDPRAIAHAHMTEATALESAGETRAAGAIGVKALQEHGRWLDISDYLLLVSAVAYNLEMRGYSREALEQWSAAHERARNRSSADAPENPYLHVGLLAMQVLGMTTEAAELMAACEPFAHTHERNRLLRQTYLSTLMRYTATQGELGSELDRVIAKSDELKLNPYTASVWMQSHFTLPARLLLERARVSSGAERAAAIKAARLRIRKSRFVPLTPLLQGHFTMAKATLSQLEGKHRRALRLAAEAEKLAVEGDMPFIHCEVARCRAGVFAAQGETAEALRQANLAVRLCVEHGWVLGAAKLRAEFDAAAVGAFKVGKPKDSKGSTTGSSRTGHEARTNSSTHFGSASSGTHSGGSIQGKRSLDALLALSLAASHTQDQHELSCVALDQLVALLGAERAFLFLADGDGGALTLSAARDSKRGSLIGANNHASTIVERVRTTRQAIVVTGTDEGAALGSQSAVQHGLRSILAAPLLLEGRLLGVVYLDSRLAKGIFTGDDVEILSAISAHIAISLETARASALELTVAAEREQRGLAEALRESMEVISRTLDPATVITRTLEAIAKMIQFDRAVVLVTDGERWTVEGTAGDLDLADAQATSAHIADDPFIASLTVSSSTMVMPEVVGDPPLADLLGDSGSWLAVPLTSRGGLVGVIVMTTDAPEQLGEAHVGLAAAFAGQGIVAYENARLFKAVERMATTDDLTQINNRRHFFALGEAQFASTQRYDLPFSTLMLDIDHFKQVNDRYGHAAGDDVIREVAQRVQTVIRTCDILGRYGGEEFACVLPCTGEAATVLAERIRAEVSATPIQSVAGPIDVTVSLGVGVLAPDDAHLAHTLDRADAALYEAKRAGRNRVHMDRLDPAPR